MSDKQTAERPAEPRNWRPERTQFAVAAYLFATIGSMVGLKTGGMASLLGALVIGVLIAGCLYGSIRLADQFVRGTGAINPVLSRQRARNMAIGLALGGLVIVFYIATFVRLGASVVKAPI